MRRALRARNAHGFTLIARGLPAVQREPLQEAERALDQMLDGVRKMQATLAPRPCRTISNAALADASRSPAGGTRVGSRSGVQLPAWSLARRRLSPLSRAAYNRIVVASAGQHPARAWLAISFVVAVTLGAGPGAAVRLDDWDAYPLGALELSGQWRRYPPQTTPFKHPPAIMQDAGRAALQLMTAGEAMRIGRVPKVDLEKTPWLVWEWKALVLPDGGDVRDPRRNDQAGRVMVVFEGMKGILYVWDTTAPVGTEARPDELELFERVLVVVRSGPPGIGQWSRERRNVLADYRRLFAGATPVIKLVGVESHSNDTNTRTSMLFGALRFEAR